MFYLDHISCAKYNLFENSNMDIAPILFMGVHRELGIMEHKFEEIIKISYSPNIVISLRKDIKDSNLIKKLDALQKDLNEKFGGLTAESIAFANSLDQVTLIGAFETFLKRFNQISEALDDYLTNETALEVLSDDFEELNFESLSTNKEVSTVVNSGDIDISLLLSDIKNLSTEQKYSLISKLIDVVSDKQKQYDNILRELLHSLINNQGGV